MYIALEVFNIPRTDIDTLKTAVMRFQRTYLADLDPDQVGCTVSFQDGSCPYTGDGYLSATIYGFDRVDLTALYQFQTALISIHPRSDDPVVNGNMDLRLEEDWPEIDAGDFDPVVSTGDVLCWVCGRGEGDTYYPPEGERPIMLTIDLSEEVDVPLCTVCHRLFISRNA